MNDVVEITKTTLREVSFKINGIVASNKSCDDKLKDIIKFLESESN
jgi:hypothetical protein